MDNVISLQLSQFNVTLLPFSAISPKASRFAENGRNHLFSNLGLGGTDSSAVRTGMKRSKYQEKKKI